MNDNISRRKMISQTAKSLIAGWIGLPFFVKAGVSATAGSGALVGEEIGAKVGRSVLTDGGNAVDAAVAAALTSCVATPARCGIAGYGGHMIIATAKDKVTCIDFNTVAPAAATEDMYPFDELGKVRNRQNFYGWRAVGVPGTLAGLQLALDRYGTRSFRELVQPAIRYAREGFVITPTFAATLRNSVPRFQKDPASAKLYMPGGEPLKAGAILRNPDLQALLQTLAERNSVESFYRGDIAKQFATVMQKYGGLVTAADLAGYHAREIEPLRLDWNGFSVLTPPLTAGGITILEVLATLKALSWDEFPPTTAALHARLEALRLAWKDRLELLGDPEKVNVPVAHLLSESYAKAQAERIKAALNDHKPLQIQVIRQDEEGTNNIACADGHGTVVDLTLTQGNAFGAQVTVEGLGLTLGHGMSRFNPLQGHPNSPGPGKRPLHNMCPTIVLRGGRPVLALGASGGTKIPNAILDVLTRYMLRGASMESAIASPRMHSTGTLDVTMEALWPASDPKYLRDIGFKVSTGPSAVVGAVAHDAQTGSWTGTMR